MVPTIISPEFHFGYVLPSCKDVATTEEFYLEYLHALWYVRAMFNRTRTHGRTSNFHRFYKHYQNELCHIEAYIRDLDQRLQALKKAQTQY